MRAERRASRDSTAQGSDFSSLRPTRGALMLLRVMRLSAPASSQHPPVILAPAVSSQARVMPRQARWGASSSCCGALNSCRRDLVYAAEECMAYSAYLVQGQLPNASGSQVPVQDTKQGLCKARPAKTAGNILSAPEKG